MTYHSTMTATEWNLWWEEFDQAKRAAECNALVSNSRPEKSDLSPEAEATFAKFMGKQ